MGRPLSAAMNGLAAFRIVLGAASWIAPGAVAKSYGVGERRRSSELEYMTRVFGARAIALGVGYLAASAEGRRLFTRLWLLVDAADSAMGAAMLARGSLARAQGISALATTVPSMALDIAALASASD